MPTLDEGVPLINQGKGGRPLADLSQNPYAKVLLEMDVDTGANSFYMENAQLKDVRRIRKLAARLGVTILTRKFDAHGDKLNSEPGVRVWRVSPPDTPDTSEDF